MRFAAHGGSLPMRGVKPGELALQRFAGHGEAEVFQPTSASSSV